MRIIVFLKEIIRGSKINCWVVPDDSDFSIPGSICIMGWISHSSNLGPNWRAWRITHLFHLTDCIFMFWVATRIPENSTKKSPRSQCTRRFVNILETFIHSGPKRVSRSQQSERSFTDGRDNFNPNLSPTKKEMKLRDIIFAFIW